MSPKVTNIIAQGKAASAATLGIGQQRIRSMKGSNNRPRLHRSPFVHLCGAKCFGNPWDEARNDYNLNVINEFAVPYRRGTTMGQERDRVLTKQKSRRKLRRLHIKIVKA